MRKYREVIELNTTDSRVVDPSFEQRATLADALYQKQTGPAYLPRVIGRVVDGENLHQPIRSSLRQKLQLGRLGYDAVRIPFLLDQDAGVARYEIPERLAPLAGFIIQAAQHQHGQPGVTHKYDAAFLRISPQSPLPHWQRPSIGRLPIDEVWAESYIVSSQPNVTFYRHDDPDMTNNQIADRFSRVEGFVPEAGSILKTDPTTVSGPSADIERLPLANHWELTYVHDVSRLMHSAVLAEYQ